MKIIRRIMNVIYSYLLQIKIAVSQGVHFQYPVDLRGGRFIKIGENTYFGPNLVLNAWGLGDNKPSIRIGKGCSFQPYNNLTCINHICIGDNVWIGDKATILSGVKIGNNSIIGANSVVTKDIPPFSVAVSIPAKVIRRLDNNNFDRKNENNCILPSTILPY